MFANGSATSDSAQSKELGGQCIGFTEVRAFREGSLRHGYNLIRVGSRDKKPVGKQWQHGEAKELLLAIAPSALNTGITTAGLRVFDVDVEDHHAAAAIKKKILARLPGALIRTRANSCRFAALVGAADGEPEKRSISGPLGKLEVLGAGQQVVAHGQHTTGALIEWEGSRGPDSVPREQLPVVAEDEVQQLLTECAPLLGAAVSSAGPAAARLQFEQPGPASSVFNSTASTVHELSGGIALPHWFDHLSPPEMADLVRQGLAILDNQVNDPREGWLRVLFATADAAQRGCPGARELVLGWSQRGASWTNEADFDAAWDSYKPGGITVGSLLKTAQDAGFNLSPWRDLALSRLYPAPAQVQGPTPCGVTTDPYSFTSIDIDNIPPHRPWAVGTKLIKGEPAVLAAKGGWGKSAYAISLACSAASGRDFLGETLWGDPKRVLYVNSEDDTDELQRRLIAAARHHQLTKADLQNIVIRGVNTPGHETLTTGDEKAPRVNETGINALDHIIGRSRADIVILDPLGTFCPAGLNDNGVMAQVMLRLKRLAKKHNCAFLILHHTRKDGDLASVDAIGGASAIVNQARMAFMIARMTSEESKGFKGVLPSEAWRYFRIVDAKTNLAPPAPSTQWYQLVSHELPNAAPPTYTHGDGVQVVDKVDPSKLYVSPAGSTTDEAAKRAILRAAHAANPPFSPTSRGGSERYIVRAVLDKVRDTTGRQWSDRDMTKYVESLVGDMTAAGWLYVDDVRVAGNKRKGVMVKWASTPWRHEAADAHDQLSPDDDRQIRQTRFESIRRSGTGGIDAPRPTGASNVPKRCGDLTKQGFDAGPANSTSTPVLPTGFVSAPSVARDAHDAVIAPSLERHHPEDLVVAGLPAVNAAVISEAAAPLVPNDTTTCRSADAELRTHEAPDGLDLPPFLDRRLRDDKPK